MSNLPSPSIGQLPEDTNPPDSNLTPKRTSARTHKLTDKGLQYERELRERNFKAAVSSWRTSINKMSILLSDFDDIDKIREGRDKIEKSLTDVNLVFNRVKELHNPDEPVNESISALLENLEIEHQQIMSRIADRICEIRAEGSTVSRVSLSSSRSKSSTVSKRSSTSAVSKRSNVAMAAAVLRTKLKYIDVEAKSKAEHERVVTQRKLEIAQVKLEYLEDNSSDELDAHETKPKLSLPFSKKEFVDQYVNNHPQYQNEDKPLIASLPSVSHVELTNRDVDVLSTKVLPTFTQATVSDTTLDPTANIFLPQSTLATSKFSASQSLPQGPNPDLFVNSGSCEILNLTKSLTEQLMISRLPPPEPSIFDGDPLKYPGWKSAFSTLIEQKHIPNSEKIHYLRKYLSGPVKDVVANFFLLSTEDAYEDAKALLDQRYGDPFQVACAFRNKLESWPKLAPKDSHSLLKLSDFLKQCLTAMQTIPSLCVLNDCQENRKILSKLPDWLVSRWNRIVVDHEEKFGKFPLFCNFVDFVAKEAKVACNPVTSIQSLRNSNPVDDVKTSRSGSKVERKSYGSRSFLSSSDECNHANNQQKSDRQTCPLCNKAHNLDVCRLFLERSIEMRKKFVFDKKLCFGCLQAGHISKSCKQRIKCKTCAKYHPSSLHGDLKTRETASKELLKDEKTHSGVAFLNDTSAPNKCSMVVPVYISHHDKPDTEKLVYALLDTQSDTTFILDSVCEHLGLSGVDVNLSLSTMFAENKFVKSRKVKGLVVRGFSDQVRISLPETFTRGIIPANKTHIPTPDIAQAWPHLQSVAEHIPPLQPCEVGLLIGYNCPRALVPREVIPPVGNGPYAQKTDLGWGIVGIVGNMERQDCIGLSHRIITCKVPSSLDLGECYSRSDVSFSLRTSTKEVAPIDVLKVFEHDFRDTSDCDIPVSQDDKTFLSVLNRDITFTDGHYEMPLPFRDSGPNIPNNKSVVLRRLSSLKKRFDRDERFRSQYFDFMERLVENGHAEKVPESEINVDNGHVWYIPHHGVYHPKKPDKLRVVFDCSVSFQGHCLNSFLLQGPDLTNKLVGVLCRFRKENVAIMCDIEQMFYQFTVKTQHRDFLRFLWWNDRNFTEPPEDYRMKVHLFGATSSPGCANFGLKRLASDHEKEFGSEVTKFIHRDFYVDDGLKSLPSVQEAISLIEKTRDLCSKGGLRLHKFSSNERAVLEHVDPSDQATNTDILSDNLSVERALGIHWCTSTDTFQFKLSLNDKQLSRRGLLSSVGSLYDPLGFICPVVLVAKQLLQQLCADNLGWDDSLPDNVKVKWESWYKGLACLESLRIDRCLKPKDFGDVASVELHHFSDASTFGYGQCSYIRFVGKNGSVHCSFVMGKSRVVPLKPITIPRLELTAALLSVKIARLLDQELDYDNIEHFYWTDSKIVLGYIANEAKRFHVFVANRIQQIKEFSKLSQWQYIDSKENPADIASRGLSPEELTNNSPWFVGPKFLWSSSLSTVPNKDIHICADDPELKRVQSFVSSTKETVDVSLLDRLCYFSDWYRAKRSLALCIRYVNVLIQRSNSTNKSDLSTRNQKGQDPICYGPLSVSEIRIAELKILKLLQACYFKQELIFLKKNEIFDFHKDRETLVQRRCTLKGKSKLQKLDPFLDKDDIIRVGGRLQQANIPNDVKHPIILPRNSHVTELIIRHFHERINHQGRGMTINELRSNGFWIVGVSSAVSSMLFKCVTCKRLRGVVQEQKMSDLPIDRLDPSPPFTYCAVDLFGPIYIKEGRKELKRYGVLFTCLLCRAVHVETVNSLETDSFLNCLRRFLSIRGPIRQLRCDRGTNFVGAENELREAISKMNQDHIQNFLLKENCDLIKFKMNVPSASHMGGVWERQIRSVRNVLSALLLKNGTHLDDESLRTFLYEVAAIVNSRPLSVENLNDSNSPMPLTPNHLLTMKSNVILPPPGNFQSTDIYSRKRWRRVQYLVDQFWVRWKTEFLQNLQIRSKWNSIRRNIFVGDIVLLKDDNVSRNQWRMGRVVETTEGSDGLVRKVKLALSASKLDKGSNQQSLTYLERPIHKLIVLLETGEVPVGKP